MQILDGGQSLAIGELQFAESRCSLTNSQWLAIFALPAILLPLAVCAWLHPNSLTNPLAVTQVVLASALLLAALLTVRHCINLVRNTGEMVLAIFDRVNSSIEIIYVGFFGLTKTTIQIADVHALRYSRGEWNGDSVTETVVLVLETGKSYVLPEYLSNRDLDTLRALTGIRRA